MREILQKFEFYNPEHEFFYGLVVAVLLIFLFKIFIWSLSNKKCPGISLNGENGELFITSTAIEDFVIRTLADKDEMVIDRVKLSRKGQNYSVSIFIRVAADANVNEMRPSIEERVLRQTVSRLGVDSIKTVNILLKNFSAKEKQISKRHKLALREFTSEEKAALEQDEERTLPVPPSML
ncbi:MAG: alkaline shock response membrane anchor protein AmaP [Lentisphaeraceae bacterium]|nr:alkaline shock response membrane anchor protein AmaP [Lentisphaeraceae bacterium]